MAASTSEALARRNATYRDVLDAPAHQVAEVIGGTLHTHPRPAPLHTIAASDLGDEPVSIRPFDAITSSLGDLWP